MSDETTKPAEGQRTYSQEEINKMRKADIEDYKKENAWLEQRVKNATFLADLEVQETRRLMAIMQRYQLTRPAAPLEGEPEGEGEPGNPAAEPEAPQDANPVAEPSTENIAASGEERPARTLKTVPKE